MRALPVPPEPRGAARSIADAIALSDTVQIGRAVIRAFVDALALTEFYVKNIWPKFLDTLSVTDLFAGIRNLGKYAHTFAAEFLNRLWQASLEARRVLADLGARTWASETPASRVWTPAAPTRSWTAAFIETMIYADPKDPESIEDFQIDWTAAIGSDTIVSSTWEVPSDLAIVAQSHTTTGAVIRLSGGVAGQQYLIKNVVTLTSGIVRAQPLLLPVTV